MGPFEIGDVVVHIHGQEGTIVGVNPEKRTVLVTTGNNDASEWSERVWVRKEVT